MSFESLGLAPELVKAVAERGYTEPTPIQIEAIPVGLEGRDLVGSAQTGTGKTAAFLLPILQRLDENPRKGTRALVLVPTRELAEQVLESARAYGRHSKLDAVAVYGGVAMDPQTRALRKGVSIVIATPGRLLDLLGRRNTDFSGVEVLVLDEADRMLDMGFAPDVRKILDALPAERQTLFFSATISGDVDRLARRALKDHAAVEIGRRAEAAEGVEHVLVAVDKTEKRGALAKLLGELPEDSDDTVGHGSFVVPYLAQRAVDLVLGVLPDAAGVEQDRIGLLRIVHQGVTVVPQAGDDHFAVQDVHLAADGFDV